MRVSDEAVQRLAGDPDDNRQWLALDLLDARAELERQRPVIEAAREIERENEHPTDCGPASEYEPDPPNGWEEAYGELLKAIRALDGKQSDYSPRNPNDGYPPMEGK